MQVKYSERINYLMLRLFSAIIAFLFLSCSGTFFSLSYSGLTGVSGEMKAAAKGLPDQVGQ
ncbi:MAG: hypothetical protein BHW57_03690 [Azospirillum sp. 47_25]|nr:MAG: hypothetical protein BHW57_03690 [Azospirillum sp. 47_25]